MPDSTTHGGGRPIDRGTTSCPRLLLTVPGERAFRRDGRALAQAFDVQPAAITTGKALGVPVRAAAPAPSDSSVATTQGGPLIPQIEPGAVIGAGERAGLASLVSYVPSEALTIYLAGVACVNLVQTTDTSGEKVAAVWVLFVIALIAAFLGFGGIGCYADCSG